MKKHERVIPVYFEDEIKTIWRKAGREPFFRAYIFGDDQSPIPRMKNRKYIISAGKPLTGNAPQLWRLADYLCDICHNEIGDPNTGYLATLESFNEQMKQEIMDMRARYRKEANKRMRQAEQEISA